MKFEKINDIMLLIVIIFNFADSVCKIRKKVEMENEIDISRYKEIFENIKQEVLKSQYKAMQAVNTEMIYICIGTLEKLYQKILNGEINL